jgi:DNA replication protein DnaC
MRRLRLGQLLGTLPERAALARQHSLGHLEFLEQLFSDECQRRDALSAGVRARAAHHDPAMVLEAWDGTADVTYDRAIWSELVSLRFVENAQNVLVVGPVGVGKTLLADVARPHRVPAAHQRPLRARRPAPEAPEGRAP